MSEYFISINDLSKRMNVPAHTLRYWEKQFPSTVKPTTGAGGRRYYREETARALEQIKSLLYDRGYTIDGVKKLLASGEFKTGAENSKTKTADTVDKATLAARAMKLLDAAGDALK